MPVAYLICLVLCCFGGRLVAGQNVCVVLVADAVESEVQMRRAVEPQAGGRFGRMMASPVPGMRRAALLTGRDALLSGIWGRRAAHLRLPWSLGSVWRERGVALAINGVWGLGRAAPCDPATHGMTLLEEMVLGRSSGSLSSKPAPERQAVEAWLASLGGKPGLIYDSSPWQAGDAVWVAERLEHYRGLGVEHLVVLGGGTEAPLWWSWDRDTPRQMIEVMGRLERAWLGEAGAVIPLPKLKQGVRHMGDWSGLRLDRSQRHQGLLVFDEAWVLQDGRALYARDDYNQGKRDNVLREQTALAVELLQIQEAWWQGVEPKLQRTVPYQVGPEQGLALTLEEWEPSRKRPGSEGWPGEGPLEMAAVHEVLKQIQGPGRGDLEDFCGGWHIDVRESGTYEVKLSLAGGKPANELGLGACRAGLLEVQWRDQRVRMPVLEGASRFSFQMKLEAGAGLFEATLTKQIGDEHALLGLFFLELRHVKAPEAGGDRAQP